MSRKDCITALYTTICSSLGSTCRRSTQYLLLVCAEVLSTISTRSSAINRTMSDVPDCTTCHALAYSFRRMTSCTLFFAGALRSGPHSLVKLKPVDQTSGLTASLFPPYPPRRYYPSVLQRTYLSFMMVSPFPLPRWTAPRAAQGGSETAYSEAETDMLKDARNSGIRDSGTLVVIRCR